MDKLLNLPYSGCINHWAKLISDGQNIFEAFGKYQRRTNRNRTTILAANGILDISVPVKIAQSGLYKDTLVNYNTPWNQQHKRSLMSAYNSTPYYEYYADDFNSFLDKKHSFLIDMNIELMELIASLIGVKINYRMTESFGLCPENVEDLRIAIEPKFQERLSEGLNEVKYYQIFEEKFGFVRNLSILDMLFNAGPETLLLLREINRHE